ncbi:MAG: cephalosporin hydroxylase [Coleofasciculaceae cyanobacterium RL_1_1]|nr:cephalosporin hydroxylase [Coleofasciculaceae cyanobacterium RL_1_1]
MMNAYKNFKQECEDEVQAQGADPSLEHLTSSWFKKANSHKYSYHFEWLGRPIIQYPQDIVAMQELIWSVQPDLIIETGIAHGGSLIFSASMLELNAVCGGSQDAEVLGIDIDIREHNREAIEAHPMFKRISMIQGSSIASDIVEQVKAKAVGKKSVLVCLDSNHTHDHVLAELEAYAPLVTPGSYCVVFDTIIEDLPDEMFPDRPWGVGNNPKTAVREYLKKHSEFEVDQSIDNKLLISVVSLLAIYSEISNYRSRESGSIPLL